MLIAAQGENSGLSYLDGRTLAMSHWWLQSLPEWCYDATMMIQRHIRVPDALSQEFDKAAKREYRSFNNLVIVAMQQYLAMQDAAYLAATAQQDRKK